MTSLDIGLDTTVPVQAETPEITMIPENNGFMSKINTRLLGRYGLLSLNAFNHVALTATSSGPIDALVTNIAVGALDYTAIWATSED